MKKALVYLFCAICCCMLLLYSPDAVSAAANGFRVWRDSILPVLLPFFVCSGVMLGTGMPSGLERTSLVLLSLFSGAPAGARLLSSGSDTDARSAAILNNVSPLFVYASFCCGMVGCPRLALYIIPAQLASAGIMLLIFPICFEPQPKKAAVSAIALLSGALGSGMNAMLGICSALVFFSALLGGFRALFGISSSSLAPVLIHGMLEMAGGSAELASLPLDIRTLGTASAFIFSFGGLCVYAQSLAFAPLPFFRYFFAKLLQGGISAAIAYIALTLFPLSLQVFSPSLKGDTTSAAISAAVAFATTLAAMSALLIAGGMARRLKEKKCKVV